MQTPHLFHLLTRELGTGNALPLYVPVPLNHVSVVLLLGAGNQMCRIHARHVVACVADMVSSRDRPTEVLIGPAVGVDPSAGDAKKSVADLALPRPGPFP